MRWTAFILLICCVHVSARTASQSITLSGKQVSLPAVFQTIEKQTGYVVFGNNDLLKESRPVTFNVKDMPLTQFLSLVLKGQPVEFMIADNTIILSRKVAKGAGSDRIGAGNELSPPVTISGQVSSESGELLAGVSINLEGSTTGTRTDNSGRFSILANMGDVLRFSFIGFQQKLVKVTSTNLGMIRMGLADSKLDDVQIIAYGTTTKRLNTGSVGSVKAETIEKQPVGNVLNALTARVPGLDITQQSGLPGSRVTVRIRGTNSLTATANDPLFLIDGVPFLNNATATTSQSSFRPPMGGNSSPFNSLNPSDIESIEILKDADATAIYGSRGANGVVLITTKRSKTGQTKVDLNVMAGVGKVARMMDVLNRREYLDMRYEALKNDGVNLATATTNVYDLKDWDTTRNTDWQEYLIGNTANYTNAQLTLSGGNTNTHFSLGASYWKETTVIPGDFSDIKRSLRFSVTHNSTNNRLKAVVTGTVLNGNNNLPGSAGDLAQTAATLSPVAPPVYKPDGKLNFTGPSFSNPLAALATTYEGKSNNLSGNALFSYQLVKGLELKANVGYSNFRFRTTFISPSADPNSYTPPGNRIAEFGDHTTESWNVEPQLNYNTLLAGNKLNILAGTTFQQTVQNGDLFFASGFVDNSLMKNKSLATSISSNFSFFEYRYQAVFMRANYNINDKYLLNLTGRRDGSSRFGPGKRFGNFGAIGAAWIFSEERLIKDRLPFISFGKLRASYGISGSDAVANYGYLSLYNSAGSYQYYGNGAGIQPANLVNDEFHWETNRKSDIALEMGFLKDRILMNANYYRNRSSNQLVGYPVSGVSGFTSIPYNLPATVENAGWEFELITVNVRNEKFTWSTSANLTLPKNKLIEYPLLSASSFANTYVVGKSLNIVKVAPTLGVNPATGTMEYQNRLGQKVTNIASLATNDRTVAIDIGKQLYGGISNTLNYKQFQLDVFFQFSKFNGLTYNVNGIFVPGNVGSNLPRFVYEGRWQKAGQSAEFNKLTQSSTSDAYRARARNTDDAAYGEIFFARLKNLALSYTVNQKWVKKRKIQNVRIYGLAQNLVTITGYKGMDPENQGSSIAPIAVISLGAQITF